ncbi:glutathione S-transferase family protein [Pseudoroseicyclus tamaricis]|uniref:Glutathione S-transferase family protein n=1 Tax=Pseudoroseicyclus tamaricis TaxID=2705421 RepID=A0A6B2JMB0_9RHOB|nr:glutathione S-transferase family protein [Pseudoroseicyclus tamaricis]NDV02723.1 glutathione S-transferase family protein [Pseudoroseicyclus tamaricis]
MQLVMSPNSPYVRKVCLLVREAGREAEVEEVAVATTAYDSHPTVLGANPLGRIPALIRPEGPALYDSRVITRYLDDRWHLGLYPEKRLWEVLTLEATAEGILDSAVSAAYEARLRETPDQRWMDAQWEKVARALDAIEGRWMSHLAGPLDIAQISVAAALGYLDFRHAARDWRAGRPDLSAWAARFAERPAMRATMPPG